MTTCVTFAATASSGVARQVNPVVFVDGHPEPRLAVRSLKAELPLGLVAADMVVQESLASEALAGKHAAIALPRTLVDATTRWQVLASGRLTHHHQQTSPREHRHSLTLLDDWQAQLDQAPSAVWHADADDQLQSADRGTLAVGHHANRSTRRFPVNGREVHVLQRSGLRWTLGVALDTISTFCRLDLDTAALPPRLRDQALDRDIPFDSALRSSLTRLLEAHQLVVHRELSWVAGRVRETRLVRPLEHGRRIFLPAAPPAATLRIDRRADPPAAQRWVVQGQRPIVESTFLLHPGWDSSLEGQADEHYSRGVSPDFSRYANVFRRWVLNEDGQQTAMPHFDLAAFFDQPALVPTPLRFGDNLTLDDAGHRLPPVAQLSLDGGQNWQRLTQPWSLLDTAAGLHLDADTLAPDTLAAAKSGQLRLRLTASLQSPRPRTASRWRGNPFASTTPDRVFDLPMRFRFQRVEPGSLHHPAILAGQLAVQVHDDTAALDRWLIDRLARAARHALTDTGRATLTLSRARPELRPGDRLPLTRELRGLDPDRPDEINPPLATVTAVACDLGPNPTTTLTLHF